MRPRGAQLRCLLKPGDTDSAVGGPQLDRSGEQHGGSGARAGLHPHLQRGDEREDACPFLRGSSICVGYDSQGSSENGGSEASCCSRTGHSAERHAVVTASLQQQEGRSLGFVM